LERDPVEPSSVRHRDAPILEFQDADLAPPSATRLVLTGVNLRLRRGEVGVLLGANGSGKTTVLRTAAGLWPARRGQVSSPSRDGFDARQVGLILEEPAAQFVAGSVRGEIEFVLESLGLSMDGIRKRVDAALSVFGLESLSVRDPRSLSGGEQQRCLLAAALAPEPTLLLLDDPFLYLGPGEAGSVWGCVVDAVRSGRVGGVLLAGHDPEPAIEADLVGILEEGELRRWEHPARVLGGELPRSVETPFGPWLETRLTASGWRLSGSGWDPDRLAERVATAIRE
jgi:energy-coupling factor transporter ATP-binding protein EcfA2